jgi:Kyakuja-Dileera-Zisupton transposase
MRASANGNLRFDFSDLGVAQALRWRYVPLLTGPDREDLRFFVQPPLSQLGLQTPVVSPPTPSTSAPPLAPHTDRDNQVSTIFSYDIICSWHVNAEDRMKRKYSDVYAFFEDCKYTIPLLHIQNHQDNCTYLYSSAFTHGAAHFHGETAEHPWFYVNQFGGQGRQMSHGNRHDLYADVFNNWNWKKFINLRES